MNKFSQNLKFTHDSPKRVGVLITNLGTPSKPTSSAIRTYLREFLSDPRVIEIPKPIWQIILNGFILPFRPGKLKHSYETIWTEQGSPLLAHSLSLITKLKQSFANHHQADNIVFAFGMRYGEPSIDSALKELYQRNCQYIFVLPMYPQYSATTTGSTFDSIAEFFKKDRFIPELRFLNQYCDHPSYIQALAEQVKQYIQTNGKPEKFVFSFHGLPKRNLSLGDPYHCQCHKTARLLAEAAGLTENEWMTTFQSRFGKAEWLQPYTDKTMEKLAKEGVKRITVMCPGFPIDCLETIEEINIQNREIFLEAGGEKFDFIPGLNDSDLHAKHVHQLILEHIESWLTPNLNCPKIIEARKERVESLG